MARDGKTNIVKTGRALLSRVEELHENAEKLHAKVEDAHMKAEEVHQRVRESKRHSRANRAKAATIRNSKPRTRPK